MSCVITVQNLSAVSSGGFSVADLPNTPGALYSSSSGSLTCAALPGPVPPAIYCNYSGAIPAGGSLSSSLNFSLPQGGTFQNCVEVTSRLPDVDPNLANNKSCAKVVVPPPLISGADLQIEKKCTLDPTKGPQAVSCVVNVKNLSSVPSGAPVTVTDLPNAPGAIYNSSSGSFMCSTPAGPVPATIPCTYNGSIPGGGSGSTFYYFTLPQGGTFENCATVTQGGTTADPNLTNNKSCAKVVVPPPLISGADLQIEKKCTLDPAKGPQAVSCVVNVNNLSSVPSGAPVTVTDFPNAPGAIYNSSSGSFMCSTPAGPVPATIPCTYNGSIPGGGSGSTFYYFTLPQGGTFENCATVTQGGTTADPNLTNNKSCAKVVVPPAGTATLKIVKKVSQPPSSQAFNFTMTGPGLTGAVLDDDGINGNPLSNSKTFGNVAAGVPLTITEDAVSGWTLNSVVCTPGTGTTVNLPMRTLTANLTPGANVTCTFTNSQVGNTTLTVKKVLVPPTDPGKFTLAISTSSGTLLGNFLNGGNGATAGPIIVPAGNYVVSETAGSSSPTTLAQYISVISGAGCAANGNVTIAVGDNKVCTITNTRISGPWPNTATVNIYNPMQPFGPQTVNINAGGTVTFNNNNSGANWTITWFSGPASFPSIPLPNNGTGVTVPLTVPGAYQYVINGTPPFTVHGHIIVH